MEKVNWFAQLVVNYMDNFKPPNGWHLTSNACSITTAMHAKYRPRIGVAYEDDILSTRDIDLLAVGINYAPAAPAMDWGQIW